MNIAMTQAKPATAPSLEGQSVPGDRLDQRDRPRHCPGAGRRRLGVVLNGFGKPDEIEAAQDGVAADFGVKVDYSGADMSKPASIAEMIETTLAHSAASTSS